MSALPGVPQHRRKPPTDTRWMTHANCQGTPTSWWFPRSKGITEQAAHLCGACTVQAACLEYALTHHEWVGTWGGYSEADRRELARRRGHTTLRI